MKADLVQYLKEYGAKSFREAPFSEVDALVFAQLSYLKMKGIVPGFDGKAAVGWQEMARHPQAEQMFADPLYGKQHRTVFGLVAKSRRYRNVKACCYKEWFDEEREGQFAAVTFLLGATSVYVSFRGTDETLVGWKEDFNMSYMKTVPAQKSALAYLKGAARYTSGRLILGGHSKGGNLAVYAAARAPEQIQARIRRIYSFDGPGFRKDFYEKAGFARIRRKYCKIIPEQAIVGTLFSNDAGYRVVKSYGAGMDQHDLMQWMIRNGRFVYRKDVRGRNARKAAIFNRWMNSLSRQQTRLFVETLYRLLRTAHVTDVSQLLKRPLHILRVVFENFIKLDQHYRNAFWQIIRKLFETAKNYRRGGEDEERTDSHYSCPYYRNGDEYAVVRKQM